MNHDPRHPEPSLFDLPLVPPDQIEEPASTGDVDRETEEVVAVAPRRATRRAPRPESLPLFEDEAGARRAAPARPTAVPPPAPEPPTAALGPRLRASAGDLAVLAAAAALAAIGARLLGVPLRPAAVAPLALFVVSFSYLYSVISLAFWGQTPGMAWAGLVARTGESEPLSFGQTSLRWFGSWLTWATLGLAGLLALSGRSLADRLSRSRVYDLDAAA